MLLNKEITFCSRCMDIPRFTPAPGDKCYVCGHDKFIKAPFCVVAGLAVDILHEKANYQAELQEFPKAVDMEITAVKAR